MLDNHNNLLANPDIYRPATAGSGYTGYTYGDVGTPMTLRAGHRQQHQAQLLLLLGDRRTCTGGSEYDWNIANCNQTIGQHRRPAPDGAGQQGGADQLRASTT